MALEIWSLRRPTDKAAPSGARSRCARRVVYLPEYLKDDPRRVCAAWLKARRLPGYAAARAQIPRRPAARPHAPTGVRRWGQALVLAAELPASIERLYAHFLHTPASVTRYAADMRGLPWSVSAHAKDIWTSEPWEMRGEARRLRLAGDLHRRWACSGCRSWRREPERLQLVYHGLDFAHLPPPPARAAAARRLAIPPIRSSSCRSAARSRRRATTISWTRWPGCRRRCTGASSMSAAASCPMRSKAQAAALGIAERCLWHGAQPQKAVFAALARADLFVLASKKAADGDQDGLPNVLMEAAHQGLADRLDPRRGDRRVHRRRRQRPAGGARRARRAGGGARPPGARSRRCAGAWRAARRDRAHALLLRGRRRLDRLGARPGASAATRRARRGVSRMRVLLHTPLKPPDSPDALGRSRDGARPCAPAAPPRPHGGDAGARAGSRRACRRRRRISRSSARARAQAGAADRALAALPAASSRALRSLVHLSLLLSQARLAGPDRHAARWACPM